MQGFKGLTAVLAGGVAVCSAAGWCGCGRSAPPAPAPEAPAAAEQALPVSAELFEQPVKELTMSRSPTSAVVMVNGVAITQGQVDQEVAGMMNMMAGRVPPEQLSAARQEILQRTVDNLVVRQLLMDICEKQNIELTAADLAEAKAKIAESLPPGKTLEDLMAAQHIDAAEFETSLGRELRIKKLLDRQLESLKAPTADEIARFYEENKQYFNRPPQISARHILLGVPNGASAEEKAAQKTKAEKVRAELLAGGDFAALAREYSSCPSKERGGDLGTFGQGQMVKPFEDAALSQTLNEIGPVVETPFGYHIIKVTERTDAHQQTLDESKTQIERVLTNQERQKAIQSYIEQAREKADVKFVEP